MVDTKIIIGKMEGQGGGEAEGSADTPPPPKKTRRRMNVLIKNDGKPL
jgi:hypothetical protein